MSVIVRDLSEAQTVIEDMRALRAAIASEHRFHEALQIQRRKNAHYRRKASELSSSEIVAGLPTYDVVRGEQLLARYTALEWGILRAERLARLCASRNRARVLKAVAR